MAKAWYPVVDYSTCVECGTCIAKCPHGVYDVAKAPTPVVKNPDECVDHCHGCGNRCPVGAITYIGDDTGWTPPKGKLKEDPAACGCGCGGECGETAVNKVVVEYLYLDLNTCDRCVGTDHELDEVMMVLTPALRLAGFEVEYNKVEMATAEIASTISSSLRRRSGSMASTSAGRFKRTAVGAAARSAARTLTAACSSMTGNPTKCRPRRCSPKQFCALRFLNPRADARAGITNFQRT